MKFNSIAFVGAKLAEARKALKRLKSRYDNIAPGKADVIVALGGDGFMLRTLHQFMQRKVPIFGMNRGTVGFLMNEFDEEGLLERLERAEAIELHPLRMAVEDRNGKSHEALAINEISLLRQTRLAAKVKVRIDGVVRLDELFCDGVLACTPAGSTAYNFSVNGPILPLGAGVLAVTPISAFRPRRWRGAIVPHDATISFEILDAKGRPVSAVADYTEVRDVTRVVVREDRSLTPVLLFDPEHNLEERIIKEQFQP